MKSLMFALVLLSSAAVFSQDMQLESKVYSWDSTKSKQHRISEEKIFSGSGAVLAKQAMKGVTLSRGTVINTASEEYNNEEHFFIVKNGALKVAMHDNTKTLGRGSVICIMPGDRVSLTAMGDVQLYEIVYASKPADKERAKKTGGSFMIDWNNVTFKPHDKGGVRQFFDRQTEMLNRFDIHVTTLNPNNKSHDPHTHKNEEIILMLQGNAEMQIGTDHQNANSGDVVYLGSNVLHNLTNIGTVPCIYYAIQWN